MDKEKNSNKMNSDKKRQKKSTFNMWERYKLNEKIKEGYEKYMESKENNNKSNTL